MDRRIKFRHLECFASIARARSLKRAAGQLHLTQPAISKTLKELENILGATLMERSRSGVTLTREGEVFLQYAESALAALQHGLTSLDALSSGQSQRVAIGALPSVAAKLLPDAALRFRALAPRARIEIKDGPHGALVDKLRAGALDLVVGRLGDSASMTGISFTQLYAEHVVVVVAPDHPLADGGTLEDIALWPVLYPSHGSAIRPLVDRFFIANGIATPPDRVETVSGDYGRAMALGPTQAVWIISHGVVAGDIAAGRLVALAVDTALTAGPVGIMARADDDLSPAARQFRKALMQAADIA